jgi:hypothetical protein
VIVPLFLASLYISTQIRFQCFTFNVPSPHWTFVWVLLPVFQLLWIHSTPCRSRCLSLRCTFGTGASSAGRSP